MRSFRGHHPGADDAIDHVSGDRHGRHWVAAVAFATGLAVSIPWASRAGAQQQAQGFAVERFYPSAPGAGWFVMDDLAMRGGIGGAVALTGGYAYKPLVVTDGLHRLGVVTDQAFADVGLALTYDRYRFYLNFSHPMVIGGEGGTVGSYTYTAPSVDAGKNPDLITDVRVGYDVRLVGLSGSPFRLGVGAQLLIPNGDRPDYDTDGTFRAMVRVLFAGDTGIYSYAGQLGWHIRSLDDSPTPGSPLGSEVLFGIAAGPRFPISPAAHAAIVVGPEIYGETALHSFFGTTSTGLEALLTGRIEGTDDDRAQLRVKLGAGGGISAHFGAPEWRFVAAVELFQRDTDRDHDGISDSRDACPGIAGVKTSDPKTNGCPVTPLVP